MFDRLVHLFVPAFCVGCEVPLSLRSQTLNLCDGCRADLEAPPDDLCRLCASTCATDSWLCAACLLEPPAFETLLSAWRYEPPIDAVIGDLKFRGLEYLAPQIADRLVDLANDLKDHDLVTAVPLHWRRYLQRRFNQSIHIARPLARRVGVPFRQVLVRTRPTASQTALGRAERRRNLRDCFRTSALRAHGIKLEGARVLLVDDVATTGATLDQAARALHRAGVGRITALTAARTPMEPYFQAPKRT